MLELKKAKEQRGQLVKQADEIIRQAASASRDLTKRENERISEIRSEIFQTDLTIQKLESELRSLSSGSSYDNSDLRHMSRFSIARAITELAQGRSLDGIEAEVNQEGQRRALNSGISVSGNLVLPDAVLAERRDLTATGQTTVAFDQGGHLVATQVAEPVSPLYARTVLRTLGARLLTDLTGNVSIPKIESTTISHKAETAAFDESSPATSQISLTPNRIGTFVEISKQLLLQTGNEIERLIRADLLENLALAIENGAINGTGADNQPLGLLHPDSGIDFTSVVGGTNGSAPSWEHVVGLETAVLHSNSPETKLAYVTNSKVRGKLKTTLKAETADSFIWPEGGTRLNGHTAAISSLVPSNLDKGSSTGVCSAMLFGNFDDLIVAMWGGLDIQVNPYIKDVEGLVRITASTFYDTAIRRPSSFAAMVDALA